MKVAYIKGRDEVPAPKKAKVPLHKNDAYILGLALDYLAKHNLKFKNNESKIPNSKGSRSF